MGEDKKPRGPRAIGDLVAEVLKRSVGPRRKTLAELSVAWTRAAGPDTARRSRPLELRGADLVVSFDSSVLRQEVECFRKEEILVRLNAEYPARRIANLKCVLHG